MKLRQVAIAAHQLEPCRQQLFALLDVSADFADPGVAEFGLENSVIAIGDSFLEVVAPTQSDTAAGRTLAKRGDTCGYMVLMQVDDFATYTEHLNTLALRRVWEVERAEVSACHIHPKDIGGAIVSFDEMRPPESWLWAGPNWQQQRAAAVQRILGCTLGCTDPQALAVHWGNIMQTPTVQTTEASFELQFADGTFVRFQTDGVEAGVVAITFAVDTAGRAAEICRRAQDLSLETDHQDTVHLGKVALQFKIEG